MQEIEVLNSVAKVFLLGIFSFLIAFFSAPVLSNYLYKHKLWKKKVKEKAIDGGDVKYFRKFHSKGETNTPRLGGLLIWVTVVFLSFFFLLLSSLAENTWVARLNFLSREQTWLPIFTLVVASLTGLLDDLLQVIDRERFRIAGIFKRKLEGCWGKGLRLRHRLFLVTLLGIIGAWWFYFKLGNDSLYIPFWGDLSLGFFYIPFFIIVMLAVYSGGVIDGIDGLSGGVFASIFTAYGAIALLQNQVNLAAFCFVLVGSILAFLWFNIPPARFYMGETGILGLTTTLTVVVFLTNAVVVLPVISLLLVLTSGSVIIQLLSKKFRKKKIFLSAPLHHHFEAKGWPSYKVTMRFWVIGVVVAIIGVVLHLLG